MRISDLKAASEDVISDAACDATIISWVQAVLDFIDMAALKAGDLKSQKPQNDGGDPKVKDWIIAALELLDDFA